MLNPDPVCSTNLTVWEISDEAFQSLVRHWISAITYSDPGESLWSVVCSWQGSSPTYMRIGHPKPSALKHLVNAFKGMKIKGLIIVQCEICALAKIRKQIKRASREFNKSSGEHIAVNFHDYASEINEYTFQIILTNRATNYV
jgi:hypothetical protein